MVYRIYVEKKPGLDNEAAALLKEADRFLGLKGLEKLRVLNRYDVEDVEEALFRRAVQTVFSEPQVDNALEEPDFAGARAVFAVEYLPGQFDQRADSAAQCIQIMTQGQRPLIHSARVYVLYGSLTEEELEAFRKHVINPVEAREASLEKPATLRTDYAIPTEVAVLEGFLDLDRAGLERMVADLGLAMDAEDIAFCQAYFRSEGRNPTITEIRMLDTYWSDHCRHTTFLTRIDSASFEDPLCQKAWEDYLRVRRELGREKKPVCLMDLATVGARYLKAQGKLPRLDESEEINACTVKIDVERDGVKEPWLLLLSLLIARPFCRYLCPLGAIYGLFNRFALLGLTCDASTCVNCGACETVCPMGIDPVTQYDSPECIRCGRCARVCPTKALKVGVKAPLSSSPSARAAE